MGGINNGPGGNNEEREDLRQDTEKKEANAAGLALEDIGLNAKLDRDDQSDPANFISADLSSQGLKDHHDEGARHHDSGLDPDGKKAQYDREMAGTADGHIAGTYFDEAEKKRQYIIEQRNNERAARLAAYGAVASIADIQTFEQAQQYHAKMGAELQVLEEETEEVRREFEEITEKYDQHIDDLKAQIERDQDRIVTLEPGSEERIRLAIKIRTTEHTLDLLEQEREELKTQWDEHTQNLADAKSRHADIQRQIDAGASGGDLERLKAELQEAENAMNKANTSLDRVENRIEFSDQLTAQSMNVQQVMAEDQSHELFEVEQLRAQAELSQYFITVRMDGEISPEEFQRINELRAQGGIDSAGIAKLENTEGPDAERAQRLATELRAAETNAMSGLASSGIGIQEIDAETGQPTGNILYGEEATAQIQKQVAEYDDAILRMARQQEGTKEAAAEVSSELNQNATSLNAVQEKIEDSAETNYNNIDPLASATSSLSQFNTETREALEARVSNFDTQITDAKLQLEQLELQLEQGTIDQSTVDAMKDQITELETQRNDVATTLQSTQETATLISSLKNETEQNLVLSENSCVMAGVFEGHNAKVEALVLANEQGLSPEETQAAMEAAEEKARADHAYDFSKLTVPLTEVIGSAGQTRELTLAEQNERASHAVFNATQDNQITAAELDQILANNPKVDRAEVEQFLQSQNTEILETDENDTEERSNWDSSETLELGTTEADMQASQRLAAVIEGGQITAAQLDEAIASLDVDPETIERRLTEQGIEVLKPDADTPDPTNSIFVDGATPQESLTNVASHASLDPAGPNAIKVPHTPIVAQTSTPEPIIGTNNMGLSFADQMDADPSHPPLAGADRPINNGTSAAPAASQGFGSALANTGAAPTQPAATGGAGQSPTPTTDAATAAAEVARRQQELQEAELLAQQQNNAGGAPGTSGAPGAGGGSTIT